jgi:hypothetical protein
MQGPHYAVGGVDRVGQDYGHLSHQSSEAD